jgi:hypothetical protein
VERQTAVRFEYDGLVFEEGFRTDLIVDHQAPSASPRLRVNQSAPNRLPEALTEQH